MKVKTVYHPNGEYWTWLIISGEDFVHHGDGICYPKEWQASEAGRLKLTEFQTTEAPN